MKKAKLLVTLILVLGTVLLALPVVAAPPAPLELIVDMDIGPGNFAEGPFTLSYDGMVVKSGWATETFFHAGQGNMETAHGIKVLQGANGEITLRFDVQIVPNGPGQLLATGRWRILSGTGVYTNLHGGGDVHTTIDLTTSPPSLHAQYSGQGHFDP